jgi:hypothetical protein
MIIYHFDEILFKKWENCVKTEIVILIKSPNAYAQVWWVGWRCGFGVGDPRHV